MIERIYSRRRYMETKVKFWEYKGLSGEI